MNTKPFIRRVFRFSFCFFGAIILFCTAVTASGAIDPPLSVDLQPGSDSGLYDNDDLTNISTSTIDIIAARQGDTINVYREGTLIGVAALVSGTLYEYTFTVGQLIEGVNAITARSYDGVEESGDSPVLEIVLDTVGPQIIGHSPLDPFNIRTGVLDSVTITFNESIDFDPQGSGSFTVDDVIINGPDGAISPDGIVLLGSNSYEITFNQQTSVGTYTVTITPDIMDIAGNLMDQDGDGVQGEAGEDEYTFYFNALDADTIFSVNTTIGSGDITYDGQDIYIYGGTVTINGTHVFNSLYLNQGAILTHSSANAGLDLTITGDLVIDSGGFISANGQGYGSNSGPGAGQQGGNGGGGGGYGGVGGNGYGKTGGGVYGSISAPVDLGSGGGYQPYYQGYAGGAGGGAVRLIVNGTLTVNGELTANGNNGGAYYNYGAGGGSGGSIWLTVGTLSGNGNISVNGGNATGSWGGGGGGGRIALYFNNYGFTGAIAAQGGSGYQYGGAGTVYKKSSVQSWGELLVDNGGHNGTMTSLTEPYTFDEVVVANNGKLELAAVGVFGPNQRVRVADYGMFYIEVPWIANELTIDEGGSVYVNAALTVDSLTIPDRGLLDVNEVLTVDLLLHVGVGGSLKHHAGAINVLGDLVIDSGGFFSANGQGYGSNSGPGAGQQGSGSINGSGGGGGGYGGVGGNGYGTTGGGVYGSISAPVDLGSGGGYEPYWVGYAGGAGGGAVRLIVNGTLTVNGELTANGNNGGSYFKYGAGGGSGGSIWLTVGTLSGNGNISVNGGNATGSWGGGGGGGRIALYFDNYDFTGLITAQGGSGYQYGGSGTIYTIPENKSLQLNKQTIGYLETPFSVQNWQFSAVAGQQIRLQNISMSSTGIVFDLIGPNGWTGFTGISTSSSLITLPYSGQYTLTARGTVGTSYGVYSFRLQETIVNILTPGIPFNGTFAGSDQAQLFKIVIAAGQPMRIVLDDTASNNVNEVYVKFGTPPTRGDYDYRFAVLASSDQIVLVPMVTPGTWYVLVYGNTIATPSSYTLAAQTSSVFLSSVTPAYHSNTADAILTLTGAGFDATTQVELVNSASIRYSANAIQIDSFTQLTATFNAGTVPADTYSVVVSLPVGGSDQLVDAFTMIVGGSPKLQTKLIIPSRVGYHNIATIWVEYSNTGNIAMRAPLLVVSAMQQGRQGAIMKLSGVMPARGFWTSAMPQGFSNTVQFLASGNTAGILQPGETFRVPVQYAGWLKPWDLSYSPITFNLGVLYANDTTVVDWASLKLQMQPQSITDEVWDAIWANFITQVGTTWGDYVTMLTDNAIYLGKLGQKVTDIADLLSFEFAQADALNIVSYLAESTDAYVKAPGMDIVFSRVFPQIISGRYAPGSFGRGWSHNWEMSLIVETDGTVRIEGPAGSRRIFQPDSRYPGKYFSMEGDYATLTGIGGGVFTLQEPGGIIRAFRTDGKLDYVEDTNGNRITAGYTGHLLTGLTHSAGQTLQITYNTSGLIDTITDPDGRQTTYAYDAGSEHLLSADYFDGSHISYQYSTGAGIPEEHAITQITFPGGSHQYFTYDANGRLASVFRDGGSETAGFSYDNAGMVSVDDSFSNTAKYYLDHNGLLAKAVDPQNDPVHMTYDSDFNLTKITDPKGHSYVYQYDNNGNLIYATEPLGYGTRFSYNAPFNRMTSLMDSNGNITDYAYDTAGNLNAITYDDTSAESWTYDNKGNPVSWTNRRGIPLTFQYDTDGRITAKIYNNGSQADYSYDTRGNLISASDSIGMITLEYYPDDRLKKITHPGGRFLEYTYNSAGQRASSVNQLGHRLDYHYDAVGRLDRISDETSADIVRYTYDAAGRLQRKDLGNGVYTTYNYDEAWQLTGLINYDPGNAILSQFIYTYDSRGRRTSMTTTEGVWSYQYDDIGQLTGWTAPDGQQVNYQYDPLGNRITVTDNGVVSNYTTNNMNQYTQVDNTTYQYDADGNLINEISPAGTTTYTYNDENRLIAVSSPAGNWIYTYYAFGSRIRVDDNGTLTDFVVDPIGFGDVVGEYDNGTGNLIAQYDHGIGLVARKDSIGNSGYYTFDAIGNTSELTDNLGVKLNSYSYFPFGEQRLISETVNNVFEFVGEFGVMSENSSLHYMRERYYEASLGRFNSMDPIGLLGRDINLYRYVRNKPVHVMDPLGLRFQDGSCPNNICPDAPGHCRIPGATERQCEEYIKNLHKDKWWQLPAKYPGFPGSPPFLDPPGTVPDPNPWYCRFFRFCSPKPEKTPIPLTQPGGSGNSQPIRPWDPNEKTGPGGFGAAGYIADDSLLPYRVGFENYSSATAPAQVVTITDQLDSDLDWATFELTEIGFGDVSVAVPTNSQHFETTIPMTFNGTDFEVQIEAGIHLATGEVYANFYSLDPLTGLPPDVTVGFLPPEDGTGRGQGFFSYIIKANTGLPVGTEIRNVALITFDFQTSIGTNWVDPLDPSQGTDPNKEALVTIAPATVDLTTYGTSGGSVTVPGESTYTQNWGDVVSLIATPDTGYVFINWTGDVGTISDINAAETTVTMYGDFSITANFTTGMHPVADAGRDVNAVTGDPIILDGSDSFDPEGEMISFTWSIFDVPFGSNVTDNSISDISSAMPEFAPDVDGAYTIELTVDDGILQDTDTVTIHADQSNVTPNANAGPDQNVLTGSVVTLDGSRSNDPDDGPEPLSYLWSFDILPPASLLNNSNIIDSDMAYASFTPDADGTYELRLNAYDGNFASEDLVQIIATSSDVPPNANAGEDITISLSDTAYLDGSTCYDPDNLPQPLTYDWNFVTVPAASGLTNSDLTNANTEYPSFSPDITGTYVTELIISDGQNSDFDNVAVTVYESPTIDSVNGDICLSELGYPDISVSATDPYGGNLTYSWTPLNGGAIVGSGDAIQFDPPNSGPHPCPYQIELTVTSDLSGLETTQIVDVYIKNSGDANGDGVVDIWDKLIVRQHNGEIEGDPNWDPQADVTCDGYVDIWDKLKVRQQNGQTGGCVCQ